MDSAWFIGEQPLTAMSSCQGDTNTEGCNDRQRYYETTTNKLLSFMCLLHLLRYYPSAEMRCVPVADLFDGLPPYEAFQMSFFQDTLN